VSDDGLHEEHEEHVNHEAWVIPYADLLTLLMAMFIALFAMSTVDMDKFKELSVGFKEALGGGNIDAGIGGSGEETSPTVGEGAGEGPFEGGTLLPSEGSVTKSQLASILSSILTGEEAKLQQRQSLEEVESQIADAAKRLSLEGKVTTRLRNDGLEVTLVTDKVLFSSGTAQLTVAGSPLLDAVADVLAGITNPILVNGYTDNVPIATAQFPSNLYLSGARAAAVVEYFTGKGLNPHRLTAAGHGELDPIAPNDTAEGRAKNRRVEIIIQSKLVQKALDDAGIDDKHAKKPAAAVEPPISHDDGAAPNVDPNLGRVDDEHGETRSRG
jgi:chemotaxis protein MotB